MSHKNYRAKCFCSQPHSKSGRKHEGVALRRLWFAGDSCAPSDLPTKELKRRLKWHMAELGGLVPSSVEYAMHLAKAHLYDALLRLRRPLMIELKIIQA